jgi:hypothetical protein
VSPAGISRCTICPGIEISFLRACQRDPTVAGAGYFRRGLVEEALRPTSSRIARRKGPGASRCSTNQDIADTSKSKEVIVGLSAESREQVDDLVERAMEAGVQALGEPQDDGVMYMRGFHDLDGHQWSFIYMDMSAIPEG